VPQFGYQTKQEQLSTSAQLGFATSPDGSPPRTIGPNGGIAFQSCSDGGVLPTGTGGSLIISSVGTLTWSAPWAVANGGLASCSSNTKPAGGFLAAAFSSKTDGLVSQGGNPWTCVFEFILISSIAAPPTVSGVTPSAGPNTGGTQVEVAGTGFSTIGTEISVGFVPATGITCYSSTRCVFTTPNFEDFVGSAGPQTTDIQVTVNGKVSQLSSLDRFTYTARPSCSAALSCAASFGFPMLVLQCPVPVNFYDFATTPNQTLVGSGSSFTIPPTDVTNLLAGCDPKTESCSTYSTFVASPTYCGGTLPLQPPNFCKNCTKTGGICTGTIGKKYPQE
jgi:IPT/TIG domain